MPWTKPKKRVMKRGQDVTDECKVWTFDDMKAQKYILHHVYHKERIAISYVEGYELING
jgi:hypothetical protein